MGAAASRMPSAFISSMALSTASLSIRDMWYGCWAVIDRRVISGWASPCHSPLASSSACVLPWQVGAASGRPWWDGRCAGGCLLSLT